MKVKFHTLGWACALFSVTLFSNVANAAFPDDFTSGVILSEETAEDGNARRAAGFDDGGIDGNVPGLRAFLNSMSVDNTLEVHQGRLDATFGRELDFIHDQRGTWPNGPRTDGLNAVNGNVFVCPKLPVGDTEMWTCATFEFIKKGFTERSLIATWFPIGRRQPFSPIRGWTGPKEGEVLGFFVSGITRNGFVGRNNIRARTNVVFFRVGEQPGNGVMLTPEEVAELFGEAPAASTPNLSPIINLLSDDPTPQ